MAATPTASTRVYLIQCTVTGLIKIGTARNVKQRLRALQTGSPTPLKVLCHTLGSKRDEYLLHDWFAQDRQAGEWFRLRDDDLRDLKLIVRKSVLAETVKFIRDNLNVGIPRHIIERGIRDTLEELRASKRKPSQATARQASP